MALRFVDGFDHYATANIPQKWLDSGTNMTIAAGAGRNGTPGLRITSHNTSRARVGVVGLSGATAIVGTAFSKSSGTAAFWLIGIADDTGQPQGGVYYDGGTLTIRRAGQSTWTTTSTVLATASVSLSAATYYYIELKYTIDNAAGAAELRVNGSTVATVSGADTQNGGNTNATYVVLGTTESTAQGTGNTDFDDVYVCDSTGSTNNDFLGPMRVVTILPDGAGNSTDFTPSAGSNYENVDEASTDGDTTYNSETTPGDHDTYTYGALGVTGTVKGVQTNLMVRSDGAGSETIRPKIRLSATDYNGTTVGVTTSYADSREVFETSPDTATAWTVSEIDSAEFGIELVS